MRSRPAAFRLAILVVAGMAGFFPPVSPARAAAGATNETAGARTNGMFLGTPFTLVDYTNYIARLRAIGCPDKHVRHIVMSDVNDYFEKRRLDEAIRRDFQWWKPGASSRMAAIVSAQGSATLDKLRVVLLEKLLGTNCEEIANLPSISSGLNANLTGPILGAIPAERYSAAAEVCERSSQRFQSSRMARYSAGLDPDPVEEAWLRQQTRTELSRVLTPDELEEYLLRNSFNADTLRQTLRGFAPTPDEFRKIFRALDPIQRQEQVDYGSAAALSARQREEFERQCDQAVRDVLPAERFPAYLLTKDPNYQRAQADAAQLGLPEATVGRLYEVYRDAAAQREKVMRDTALNEPQRLQALRALGLEEQRKIQAAAQSKPGGR